MLIIIHCRSHKYPTLPDHGVSLGPLPFFVKITFRLIGHRPNPHLVHPILFQAFGLRKLVLFLSPSFLLFWTLGDLSATLALNANAPPNFYFPLSFLALYLSFAVTRIAVSMLQLMSSVCSDYTLKKKKQKNKKKKQTWLRPDRRRRRRRVGKLRTPGGTNLNSGPARLRPTTSYGLPCPAGWSQNLGYDS
jgi:hypothetical protein